MSYIEHINKGVRMTTIYDQLQEKHQTLQKDLPEKITPELRDQLLDRIKQLIRDIVDAGEFISNVREREKLRDILRFWGTWVYNQTDEYPQSQLEPFKVESRVIRGRTILLISVATLILVVLLIVAVLVLSNSPVLHVSGTPTQVIEVSPPNVFPPSICPDNFWPRTDPAVYRWQSQTNDKQAVMQIKQLGDEFASASVLELQIDLDGKDEHKDAGEAFIDLRFHSPTGLQAPLNLEDVPIIMAVYVPSRAEGTVEQPNGVQIFVKSQIDPKDSSTFKSEYGTWINLTNNTDKWLPLSLIPGRTKPPDGDMEEGFDPTHVVLVGINIAAQKGADVNYSGPIWISDVCWQTQ